MLLKGASLPESMGRSPTQARARSERRCHSQGVQSLVERCRNGLCIVCGATVICAVAVIPISPAAVLAVTVIITPLPKWSLLMEDTALCRGYLASQRNP